VTTRKLQALLFLSVGNSPDSASPHRAKMGCVCIDSRTYRCDPGRNLSCNQSRPEGRDRRPGIRI